MKNNKGFSIIELIVVLAVVAVLTSVVSMSVGFVFGLDAKECAQELDDYLKMTKTSALSKDAQELKIYRKASDNKYYVDFIEYSLNTGAGGTPVLKPRTLKTECIGKETVTIEYVLTDSSGYKKTIDDTHSITIGYDRSTGAFQKVKENSSVTTKYCSSIIITRGSREYILELVPETGKHFIK